MTDLRSIFRASSIVRRWGTGVWVAAGAGVAVTAGVAVAAAAGSPPSTAAVAWAGGCSKQPFCAATASQLLLSN
ncbi:MAG: hypothetical protein WC775_05305 [Patescibacteria group bacterium]